MIPISKAIKIIRSETQPLSIESIDLAQAVGRILAEDIIAETDLPPFDRSQMDGFAVIAKDTADVPADLNIAGESAAGKGWHGRLKDGEAIRIMTGAPVPKGADAIQKVELTCEMTVPGVHSETVKIIESVKKGQFIVPKGFEVRKGEIVIMKGEVITPNMIASLAAFSYSKINVSKQPRITILPTGSEIVGIAETPGTDQIRDSNSMMLKALCEHIGCTVELLPIADDDLRSLKSAILNSLGKNSSTPKNKPDNLNTGPEILIITGGVSVGKYDFTKTALLELGAEIFFDRVQLKPGKPTVFAKLGNTLIFGLPGNPVSAAVTFYLFVRTAAMQMQNAANTLLLKGFAILGAAVKAPKERDSYIPAELKTDKEAKLTAKPLKWHGSSDFIGFAKANALILAPKTRSFDRGDIVEIVYL